MLPIMQLSGFHHLTAVTAHAAANHAFYTRTLGLRLVKKTVNQDDVSAYHLFYADGIASPGTDMTFFDWPVRRERRGTSSVVRTGLRVADDASLAWWERHLSELGVGPREPVAERDGLKVLDFEDPEGQRLSLVVDPTPRRRHSWRGSPVPEQHQILGLGPITISVPHLGATHHVLTEVMNMRREREYVGCSGPVYVYAMGEGGPAAELHVALDPKMPPAELGAGGVHHVAFRTPDVGEYEAWNDRLRTFNVPSSGPVNRHYFRSLYFREPSGILFEIATDGPGFAVDEPLEHLGEKLALPPFLEARRAEIERDLKPLTTA